MILVYLMWVFIALAIPAVVVFGPPLVVDRVYRSRKVRDMEEAMGVSAQEVLDEDPRFRFVRKRVLNEYEILHLVSYLRSDERVLYSCQVAHSDKGWSWRRRAVMWAREVAIVTTERLIFLRRKTARGPEISCFSGRHLGLPEFKGIVRVPLLALDVEERFLSIQTKDEHAQELYARVFELVEKSKS